MRAEKTLHLGSSLTVALRRTSGQDPTGTSFWIDLEVLLSFGILAARNHVVKGQQISTDTQISQHVLLRSHGLNHETVI